MSRERATIKYFLLWNNSTTNTTEWCIENSVHRRTLLGTVPERKTLQFFQKRLENLSNKSVIVKSIKNMKIYVIFCVVLCFNGWPTCLGSLETCELLCVKKLELLKESWNRVSQSLRQNCSISYCWICPSMILTLLCSFISILMLWTLEGNFARSYLLVKTVEHPLLL